jgi:hypothetical protein
VDFPWDRLAYTQEVMAERFALPLGLYRNGFVLRKKVLQLQFDEEASELGRDLIDKSYSEAEGILQYLALGILNRSNSRTPRPFDISLLKRFGKHESTEAVGDRSPERPCDSTYTHIAAQFAEQAAIEQMLQKRLQHFLGGLEKSLGYLQPATDDDIALPQALERHRAGTNRVRMDHPIDAAETVDFPSLMPSGKGAGGAYVVVTRDDVRRSDAKNIKDLSGIAPLVQTTQIDEFTLELSFLGLARLVNKVLIVIDRRTVCRPTANAFNWDHYNVPLEKIERIEVLWGPVWGANVLDCVINLITNRTEASDEGIVNAIATVNVPAIDKALRADAPAAAVAIAPATVTVDPNTVNGARLVHRGRRLSDTAVKICDRWAGLGRPNLNAKLIEELARTFYPDEFSKAEKGSKRHKNLRDRVGGAIRRHIMRHDPEPIP